MSRRLAERPSLAPRPDVSRLTSASTPGSPTPRQLTRTPSLISPRAGAQARLEASTEQDPSSLLFGLVESAQLAPAIKTILDRDWTESYVGYLDQAIKSKEQDLNTACDTHFQELVDSVDNILLCRNEAQELRQQITTLDAKLQATTASLLQAAEEYGAERTVRQNICITMYVFQQIGRLFKTISHAYSCLEQNQYAPALAAIQSVSDSLPQFSDFEISQELAAIISRLKSIVRDTAKNEFTYWLHASNQAIGGLGLEIMVAAGHRLAVNARENMQKRTMKLRTVFPGARVEVVDASESNVVGEMIMALGIDTENDRDVSDFNAKVASKEKKAMNKAAGSTVSSLSIPLTLSTSTTNLIAPSSSSSSASVSLTSLHQIVHVFSSLNQLPEFQKMYSDRRSAALNRILRDFRDVLDSGLTLHTFRAFLFQCIGFFQTEDAIARSANVCLPRTDIKMLWSDATCAVRDGAQMLLRRAANSCLDDTPDPTLTLTIASDPDPAFNSIGSGKGAATAGAAAGGKAGGKAGGPLDGITATLVIKRLLVLFARSAQLYQLPIDHFHDILIEHMADFLKCMSHRFDKDLGIILSSERFEPFTVHSEADFIKYVVATGLVTPRDPQPSSFPATMPFSVSVPLVVRLVKAYIAGLFNYTEHVNGDFLLLFFNQISTLLSHDVNKELRRLISSPSSSNAVTVSQAAQLSLNASFLSLACDTLHAYLLTHTDKVAGENGVPLALSAKVHFKTTQTICTQMITRVLLSKIDTISTAAAAISWTASEPSTVNSEYTMDVIAYLRTALSCVVFLSPEIKNKIYKMCFDHVSDNIMTAMVEEIPAISKMTCYNLLQDVAALEDFASEAGKAHLVLSLAQLRQTCELLVDGVEKIADKRLRTSKYASVSVPSLLKIIEKYKQVAPPRTVPEGFTVTTKKEMDAILSRLKKLIDNKELM